MIRILLVSPLDPPKPKNLRLLMGGENTYTRSLLAAPPTDVLFIHFNEALKKRFISYHWSYYIFMLLQKLRVLPLGPRIYSFNYHTHFDLIYAHAHPMQATTHTPIVLSESSSNFIFLTQYLSYPQWRIQVGKLSQKIIYSFFSIVDGEHPGRYPLFVFSKWAARVKKKQFQIVSNVIYPGMLIPKTFRRNQRKKIRILFVGVWFERKGGRILLSAFRELAKKHANISLTILGELPTDISINTHEKIIHRKFVPYKELLSLYRSHDILVHIPPVVEGYGMAIPEAMANGMCCIVSDICALPEFIANKKDGLIVKPNSKLALKKSLELLIKNPKLIDQYGNAARKTAIKKFSMQVFQKQLKCFFSPRNMR